MLLGIFSPLDSMGKYPLGNLLCVKQSIPEFRITLVTKFTYSSFEQEQKFVSQSVFELIAVIFE